VFRNEALPLIDEKRFAPMYHPDNGRPNRAVETVDHLQFRIGRDGLGIIAHGLGQLRVTHCENPTCSKSMTTAFDGSLYDSRNRGSDTSEAISVSLNIGDDGLPVIAYGRHHPTLGDLRLAHCINVECSDSTLAVIETEGVVRWHSMAIGVDGLPIIAFYNAFKQDVLTVRCLDPVTCGL